MLLGWLHTFALSDMFVHRSSMWKFIFAPRLSRQGALLHADLRLSKRERLSERWVFENQSHPVRGAGRDSEGAPRDSLATLKHLRRFKNKLFNIFPLIFGPWNEFLLARTIQLSVANTFQVHLGILWFVLSCFWMQFMTD